MNTDNLTIFQRNQQSVTETKLADEMIILHVEEGEYHHLNATGAELWGWLEESNTAHSLAQKLSEKYACSLTQCHSDVINWLRDAAEKRLLQIMPLQDDPDLNIAYSPPTIESFDALKVIQGSNGSFNTDAFQTGS